MHDKQLFEHLISVLDYHRDGGHFTWKHRDGEPAFNTAFGGKIAGSIDSKGYVRIGTRFCGKKKDILCHRVVWFIETGEVPEVIDHIDHDKTNNRFCNLRNVSFDENCKNLPLRGCNTSGVCGVSWDRRNNKWLAQITINKKNTNLGRYLSKESAIAARIRAEIANGFHQNHGK